MNRITRTLLLAAAVLSVTSERALAQVTIDQNKALAGNVSPGDLPGFPISIGIPGHYKLTANLVVPSGLAGIEIKTSNVTLDLNGFSITGPGLCSGTANGVQCTGVSLPVNGVMADGYDGTVVRNGRVAGFSMGVMLGKNSSAEDLAVEHNMLHGVKLQANGLVRGIRARLNKAAGIAVSNGIVSGSVVTHAEHGILLYGGLAHGVMVKGVHYGVYNPLPSDATALRESVIDAVVPLIGVASLGGNLCNGVGC
jgi:hypothetical protein